MQINKNLTQQQVLELARYLYPDQSWVLLPETDPNVVDVKNRIHDDPEKGNGVWYVQFANNGLKAYSSGLYHVEWDDDEIEIIKRFLQDI